MDNAQAELRLDYAIKTLTGAQTRSAFVVVPKSMATAVCDLAAEVEADLVEEFGYVPEFIYFSLTGNTIK